MEVIADRVHVSWKLGSGLETELELASELVTDGCGPQKWPNKSVASLKTLEATLTNGSLGCGGSRNDEDAIELAVTSVRDADGGAYESELSIPKGGFQELGL